MIFDIINNIFLFTIATITVLLLITWISWKYFVEYKKNEIEIFIDTIDTISKSPELFDKYKDDAEEIMDAFNNILKPFDGTNLDDIKRDFRNQANFTAEIAAIRAGVIADVDAEKNRIAAVIRREIANLPIVTGWNRMTRDWHNFWSGRWNQMGPT